MAAAVASMLLTEAGPACLSTGWCEEILLPLLARVAIGGLVAVGAGAAIAFVLIACVLEYDCFGEMVRFAEAVAANGSAGPVTQPRGGTVTSPPPPPGPPGTNGGGGGNQCPNNYPRPAPWGSRDPVPSDAQNSKLQNVIKQLFKPADNVPGGTAGAVRQENATGQPVGGKFHTQKAQDYLKNLQAIYRSGGLSEADKNVLSWLVDDLVHALLKCP